MKMINSNLIPDSHFINLIKNYLNEIEKKKHYVYNCLDAHDFEEAHDGIIDIMMISFDMDQEIHELTRRNMIKRFKEEKESE